MDYEVVRRVIATIPKIAWCKVRYGKRLQISWVQSFGKHVQIHMDKKGTIHIGKEMVTRQNLNIRVEGGNLAIGDKCFINTNCNITCMDSIKIGEWCRIAPNVVIVDHDHNKDFDGGFTTAPVVIGHHTWIGANCVILKGSTIGNNCIIGAGTVVKGKIEDNTTYYRK